MRGDRRGIAGSGNVYADLRLEDPDLEMAKAKLARQIVGIMEEQHLTQQQAAHLIGIDQPKVSALVNGRLGQFSTERLMRFLTRLGLDVNITVARRVSTGIGARIVVSSEMDSVSTGPL